MAINTFTEEQVAVICKGIKTITFVDPSDQRSVDLILSGQYELTDVDIRWFISLIRRTDEKMVCPKYDKELHPVTPEQE
jgi:hypothetical protein